MNASALPLDALQPGHRLGVYRLVRLLGSGGMGQVWLAEQQQPFQRTVALKLQRERLAGGSAEAYFQIERQALAQLLHPYVAQIYDAGSMPDGSLYFAMEYVDGLRLDEWLQLRRPALPQLIDFLIKLCQGVQHAHQRGLLHRDLKPANVLVVEVAGQPVPKIIDFGVAIGLDPRSGIALGTRRAGTRAWMAPEQLDPGDYGIDVRVDVYALGLLLALSMCRVLGLDEPEAGSQYLETLFGRSTELARRSAPTNEVSRATAAMDLAARRSIPPELRAIAGRAIAQDREARYDSASALADDLQRWRDHLPVRAMGGGRWYAAACFVRRNRLATIAAAVVVLALLAGIVLAGLGMAEARRAQVVAESRRESAERLIGYMLGDFADKLRPLAKLDLLDGVSAEAMRYLQENPADNDASNWQAALNRARALRTVGEVLSGRGQAEQARQAFTQADAVLEGLRDAGRVPQVWKERGTVAYWLGYLDYRADALDEAERNWRNYQSHAAAFARAGGDSVDADLELSYAFSNLGTLAFERDRFAEARLYFSDSVQLKRHVLTARPDDAEVLSGLANAHSWLARAQDALGDLAGASRELAAQLELVERVRQRNPSVAQWRDREASALYWYGLSALAGGQLEEATRLFSRSTALYRELVAHDPTVARWSVSLALALEQQAILARHARDFAAAQRLLDEAQASMLALDTRQVVDPARNRTLASIEAHRAMVQGGQGRHADAALAVERGLKLLDAELATPSPHRLSVLQFALLAAMLPATPAAAAQLARADGLLDPVLRVRQDCILLEARLRLLVMQHRQSEAAPLCRQLLASGYRHPDFLDFVSARGIDCHANDHNHP